MTKNFSKGFTIIELLVVVAIIAVLAAIVLVNVTGYINQGKNAAIKGNLATVMTNGAIYYDAGTGGPSTPYANFCTSGYVTSPSAAIVAAGGSALTAAANGCIINAASTAWCACSTMKVTTSEPANSTFCVDSTGYKKVTQNAGLCATRCPAAGACID